MNDTGHTQGRQSAALGCRCGRVRGALAGPSRQTVNRVICYCDDCQAFAHHLGRQDLLDPSGGSDIVQVAPAALTFHQGHHAIAGLRLTEKGILRWYAACCGTPLGNMVSPAVPFIGLVSAVFEASDQTPDQLFGPPLGGIKGEYAKGSPPERSRGIRPGLFIRSVCKVLWWKLSGQSWPHPFIDHATGAPAYPVTCLTAASPPLT